MIFTAIKDSTKLGFAEDIKHILEAKELLQRLVYLTDGKLKIIHSDNGSEFEGEFEHRVVNLISFKFTPESELPKTIPL